MDNVRLIGFKFVLPLFFPFQAPKAFLDEPVNKQVMEFIDYVDEGNALNFKYLVDWPSFYNTHPSEFTLQKLLIQVNMLYSQAPPIPFEEV